MQRDSEPEHRKPTPPTAQAALGGPVCFVRGTRILTDIGEVPVEDLAPGMCAVTLGGASRLVVWVGSRSIDLRRHGTPQSATPIRIRRGAIANGVPSRDLLVSPDHALFLGQALIPARALVNGATVVPDASFQRVDYFHVLLHDHAILLAESAPAESFADTGGRAGFSGGKVMVLHPAFTPASPAASDCAPRIETGPPLHDARRALLARARVLGHAITRDPDLHLLADGIRINPSVAGETLYRFVLPSPAGDVRIVSRAGIPAETDPASDDRRRLGVLLSRMVLHSGNETYEQDLADPVFREGFHAPQRVGKVARRWTDGHARLPTLPAGVTRIELHVLAVQPAWSRATPPSEPAQRGA